MSEEYTAEQLAEAQRIVALDVKRQAEIQQARRDAYYAPTKDLVECEEWQVVLDKLTEIQTNLEPDNMLSVHVVALAEIMPRLKEVLGYYSPATPPAPISIENPPA